jgi:superfamily II DNA or RNA helicase
MRKLIERLEAMRDEANHPGDRILGLEQIAGSPVQVADEALNTLQCEAVEAALGRDTTFIWGPPGTGKTKTIGAIGCHLVAGDASVLVVSHTNTAVYQALLQIAERVRSQHPELVSSGKILRVGEPRDPHFHRVWDRFET